MTIIYETLSKKEVKQDVFSDISFAYTTGNRVLVKFYADGKECLVDTKRIKRIES